MNANTWLTVGGCPRSGTSALGKMLRGHPDISLFHEYFSQVFFDCVSSFYEEYKRLSRHEHTLKDCLPTSDKCDQAIINTVFQSTFGKDTKIIGTKMPGYYSHPKLNMPNFLQQKTIHITRDPFKTIASFLGRMEYENPEFFPYTNVQQAITQWIRAWNRAVDLSKETPDQFLHVFYDDLILNPQAEYQKIHAFLEVESHDYGNFFKAMFLRENQKFVELFQEKNWQPQLESLQHHFGWMWSDWLTEAKNRWAEKKYMAPTYSLGEQIDFRHQGNSLYFIHAGFNHPETEGTWLNGSDSKLMMCRPKTSGESVQLRFSTPHVFCPKEHRPHLEIYINDSLVFDKSFSMDDRNQNHTATISQKIVNTSDICQISLQTQNPLVPQEVLPNSNDPRTLGVMLSNLCIESI